MVILLASFVRGAHDVMSATLLHLHESPPWSSSSLTMRVGFAPGRMHNVVTTDPCSHSVRRSQRVPLVFTRAVPPVPRADINHSCHCTASSTSAKLGLQYAAQKAQVGWRCCRDPAAGHEEAPASDALVCDSNCDCACAQQASIHVRIESIGTREIMLTQGI